MYLSSLPYRSFPPELSPSYFPRLPFRPPSRHSRIAPSHRSFLPIISDGFSPSYFPRFPFRPPCRHSRIAPSSPQAFPTVSLPSTLPTGALPKLFPTVSLPSTLSSLPYRSFPPELSPSYFPRLPFHHPVVTPVSLLWPELSPSDFPRFPFRPPSRHSRIAPSHRSSPHAISHSFLSVHPIVASTRSLPTELSPSYFPRFSLRPPSRQIRIAPSRQMWLNENPSIGDAFGKKQSLAIGNSQPLEISVWAMGEHPTTDSHSPECMG